MIGGATARAGAATAAGALPPVPLPGPEAELVCACARARWTPDHAAHVRSLVRRVADWDRVHDFAWRHRLNPLVLRALEAVGAEDVPPHVWERLRTERWSIVLRSLARSHELFRLRQLLRDHGINALVVKGPVLGHEMYDDVSLRPFGDLDLIVRRADVLRTKDLLCFEGYRPDPPMTEAEERAYLDDGFAYSFHRNEVEVEVHWALAHRLFGFHADLDGVWARARDVRVGAHTVATLGVEDLLLFLCAHGAKHEWHQFILVADIAELLAQHPALDVDRVLGLARAARCERILGLGVHLASRLLEAPVPARLLAAFTDDRTISQLVDQVVTQAFRTEQRENRLGEHLRFHVRVREAWRDRARHLVRGVRILLMPSKKDEDWVKLPVHWRALYYIIRPVRLVCTRWTEGRRADLV